MKSHINNIKDYFEAQVAEAEFRTTLDSKIDIDDEIEKICEYSSIKSSKLADDLKKLYIEYLDILDNAQIEEQEDFEEDDEYSTQILITSPIPKHPEVIQDKANEILEVIVEIEKGA